MLTAKMTRRALLGYGLVGGAALAVGRGGVPARANPLAGRPFTLDDALGRTDIRRMVGSAAAERWAVEIVPPLPTRGRFGTITSALPAHSKIWLMDRHLEQVRRLSGADHWDWAPAFSPSGKGLAWLTTSDASTVSLAVMVDGGERRQFDPWPCEIEVTFGGAASAGFGQPMPFMWLEEDVVLFVHDGTKPYAPELRKSAQPQERIANLRRLGDGQGSVRVWNENSPTCGVSNALVRLNVRSGEASRLLDGDVRGVSVSPDGRLAAVMTAVGHLDYTEFQQLNMPSHRNPFSDALVRTRLQVIDMEKRALLDIPVIESVGVVSDRELPLWSPESNCLAVVCRDRFDEMDASYTVRCVDFATMESRSLVAESQLDAEVLSHLIMLAHEAGTSDDVLEARPILHDQSDQSLATSYVRRFPGGLYVYDGARAYLADMNAHFHEITEERAPAVPERLADGTLYAYGETAEGSYRWTCDEGGVVKRAVQGLPRKAGLLAVNDAGDAVFSLASAAGTRFWTAGGSSWQARGSAFALNTHLREVLAPVAKPMAYANERGERRQGVLMLPTVRKLGERPPVVIWAYPGHTPDADGSLVRLNHGATWWFPFQLLLAEGFAVFWAELPAVGDDPRDRILREIKACVELLRHHPEVSGQRLGFYGHSNAGYVALTLAAHTTWLHAIVASGTFPDWAAVNIGADLQYRDMNCGGFALQQNRYFTEGRALPYSIHAPRWAAREAYLRNSPIEHMHNLRTPLLLIQGELDTSAREMEHAYAIAQATGTPTELAFYMGESHILTHPRNVRDSHDRALGWFRRYLASPPAAPGP